MKILKEILKAQDIILDGINKTPLIFSKNIKLQNHAILYLKPESSQKTGSFKIRGVLNKLHYLTSEEKRRGIVTISAGSHALSLSYVASQFNIPLTVIMPKIVPQNKIKAIKNYGAKIILTDNVFNKCQEIQDKYKLTMIHPFDDPLIIAGQGTIGLEIIEELPDVDIVFVPIGGGGLVSGVAAAIKLKNSKIKIIGVEPIGAPTMFKSIHNNKIIRLKKCKTIADCLMTPYVSKHTFNYTKKYVDEIVLVSDKEILNALKFVYDNFKLIVEPSGVVSLAAILFKKIKVTPRAKIVCILSGGNI